MGQDRLELHFPCRLLNVLIFRRLGLGFARIWRASVRYLTDFYMEALNSSKERFLRPFMRWIDEIQELFTFDHVEECLEAVVS
jgi:hypothetical protein